MHTDGPFAETREQLGGFYLLECPDLDAALGWAAKVPDLGEGGCVEVRAGHGLRGRRLRAARHGVDHGLSLSTPGALIDRLFRRESGQAVAVLARAFGDLDRAEEAVQDAFVVALERWPRDGVPANPAAWITHDGAQQGDRPAARASAAGPRPRRSRGSRRSSRESPTSGSS